MNRPNCIDVSSRGRFRGKESIIWRPGRSPTDMTATLTVAKPQDLLPHVGRELGPRAAADPGELRRADRKSTRLNPSHVSISYAVVCLKKKTWSAIIQSAWPSS